MDWEVFWDMVKECAKVWGTIILAVFLWSRLPTFWSIAVPAFGLGCVAGIIGYEIYNTSRSS